MARFGLLLGIALLAGCHSAPPAPPARPCPPQLPVVPRGTISADVSAVPLEPALTPPARPGQYRGLTAAECRVLAIRNAPLADDLDTHPDSEPPHLALRHKKPEFAHQSRLVRGYAADELRNRAAAEALELYWKLAAAEGQFDLVAAAHDILRVQLVAAEKAVKAGLADRADADRFRRQLLDIESQMAKLEAALAVLNAGLAGHLGLDPNDPLPVWPTDPLRVAGVETEVPADQAVQTARHYRPDLNLLRALTASEDFGGELARGVLTSVNPLMATQDPTNPIIAILSVIKREPTNAEAKLHRQLVALLGSRERQADAEVRAAAATVRGNRAAVAAKAAEVRNLRAKVADLEKRAAAGVAGAQAELIVAQIDLLKLRGDLLQLAADWHVADVKLRQATGMLVRE
jgi:hypothetical protein